MATDTKKRQEARIRQQQADRRDPMDQLRRLDERLGPSEGAHQERARLHRIIAQRRQSS